MNGQNWYGQGSPAQGMPYPPNGQGNGAGRSRPPLPPQEMGFRSNPGGPPMGMNAGPPAGQGYGPRGGNQMDGGMGMGYGGYNNNNNVGGGPSMPPNNFRPGPSNLPPRPAYGTPPQNQQQQQPSYMNSPVPGPSNPNLYNTNTSLPIRPTDPRLNVNTPTPPIPGRPPFGTPPTSNPNFNLNSNLPPQPPSFGGGTPQQSIPLPRPTLPVPGRSDSDPRLAGLSGAAGTIPPSTSIIPAATTNTAALTTTSTTTAGSGETTAGIKNRPLFCVVCASNNVSPRLVVS
jgi:hypothetical protein